MLQREWEELISSLTMNPIDLKEIYHGAEVAARHRTGVNDRAKIRQVLQVMADRGLVRRKESGEYLSTLRCAHGGCANIVRDERRTCGVHLDTGIRRWHQYQHEREVEERCITAGCRRTPRVKTKPTGTRVGKRRELRCRGCAEQNVRYIKAWQGRRSCS